MAEVVSRRAPSALLNHRWLRRLGSALLNHRWLRRLRSNRLETPVVTS
jgi:hypothetical protein